MLSRPFGNERVELPATCSPAVPELPLAQSSAVELESQRLGSQRFIIAHKAACLKVEALSRREAGPQQAHCGHADPTLSHITETDGNYGRGKKWIRKLPFQIMTVGETKDSSSSKKIVKHFVGQNFSFFPPKASNDETLEEEQSGLQSWH